MHLTDDVIFPPQIEGKIIHQQKDYDSRYCGGLEPNLQYLRDMTVRKSSPYSLVPVPFTLNGALYQPGPWATYCGHHLARALMISAL